MHACMHTHTHTCTHTCNVHAMHASMYVYDDKSYNLCVCTHACCLPHQLLTLNYPFHVSVGVHALRTAHVHKNISKQ